ncbi:hypothetical protein ABZ557_13975 [Streptomyces sp. NPDC019645]|uniref:8-oxoguanine DNA glycosylase OGG fold protein n=1 Tax=Streptomyces sp. NPDC019645 TaxID=3154786 RepID=UPI0033FC8D71
MPILPAEAPIPSREDVLGQAIPFDPDRWLPLLPAANWWPEELDACERIGRWPRVDRRTVFEIARRSDIAEGRRHLLVAALVWGTGTKAQSVTRRARIFAESPERDIEACLATVLDVLRDEGAVAAYSAFRNGQRIQFLGPAFFTKVLYFAGYESPAGVHRPLILDSVVSRALRSTSADGITWPGHGWTTEKYAQYLSVVHEHAEAADTLPDQVEAALFSFGKLLP